jgi:hypothetical protein
MATPTRPQPYEEVALTRDLPEHDLRCGDVAMVVEQLPATEASDGEPGYALEVTNAVGDGTAVGDTIDVVMVPASAVKPLSHDEILQARPLHADSS